MQRLLEEKERAQKLLNEKLQEKEKQRIRELVSCLLRRVLDPCNVIAGNVK